MANSHHVKLLGGSTMARDFGHQIAELKIHIAVLDGFVTLNIQMTGARG